MKIESAETPLDFLTEELEFIRESGLYRTLREIELASAVRGTCKGREIVLFSSNDYLGLLFDPELKKIHQEACARQLGSGASRLISGTRPAHTALERELASFLGKEAVLIFSSGYMANLGVISALGGEEDVIILDKLCHASLIDAARLSGSRVRVFPHRNTGRLAEILQFESGRRRRLIVTDSVFSMDGDRAPLRELVKLKQEYGALLVVDEAHGFGVFGPRGCGLAEEAGVLEEVDVYIGTLSKAAGLAGGFIAGTSRLIEFLINKSRPFIFDTAPPPAIAVTAQAALRKIEAGDLRKRLWQNVETARALVSQKGFKSEGPSPILPLMLGEEKRAVEFSEKLLEKGLLIPAVRYPAVPRGKARLRLTVSAAHTPEDFERLAAGLGQFETQ